MTLLTILGLTTAISTLIAIVKEGKQDQITLYSIINIVPAIIFALYRYVRIFDYLIDHRVIFKILASVLCISAIILIIKLKDRTLGTLICLSSATIVFIAFRIISKLV